MKPLLYFAIPRIIYKDKPKQIGLNEFGHRLEIINQDDYITSIRPSQLGELYYNFTLFGVCFGMFIIGIIYSAIFNNIKKGNLNFSLKIFLCFLLIDIEKDLYTYFNGLFWKYLILYISISIIENLSKKKI